MQLLLVRAYHLKATDEKNASIFLFWKKEQQHIFHFVVDCPCGFILKVPPSCYLASHLQHPSVLYSTVTETTTMADPMIITLPKAVFS